VVGSTPAISRAHSCARARRPPPKVVWLNVGNAGTAAIQQLLMHSQAAIARFVADPEGALPVLTKARRT
jgi:predicted nuclease of predicted toxin-antitoxin system